MSNNIQKVSQQYLYLVWELFRVTPQGKKRARLIKPEEIKQTDVRPKTYKSDAVTEYIDKIKDSVPEEVSRDLLAFKNEIEEDIINGAISSISQLSGKLNGYTKRLTEVVKKSSDDKSNAPIDVTSYVIPFNGSNDFGKFVKEVVPKVKSDGMSGDDFKKLIALQVEEIKNTFPNPSMAVIEYALGFKVN